MVKVARVKITNMKRSVERAIKIVSDFDVKGKKILIKPNVNSDDVYPGTTNPKLLRAIVDLCFENGAKKVIVGDHSGIYWQNTLKNMKVIGMIEALKDAGAEIMDFKKFVNTKINGKYFKTARIAKEVLDAEYLINVPVLKTHKMAVFSMSMKNLMGCITIPDRVRMHASKLQEKIADLNTAIKPDLNIMDGTIIMLSGGPCTGETAKKDLVFASEDRIALDYIGLKEIQANLGLKGIDVWNLSQLKHARGLRLGVKNKENIEIVE